MQLTTIISVAVLALGAAAQKTGPNGKRICAGGAISCEYQKGRCANICGDSHADGSGTPAFIDPSCSCPEGQVDNLYTGAACIDSVAELADKLVSVHTLRRKKALLKSVIYIDLEGLNLCREGSVSILTLLIDLETSPKEVYLIDVHTLGEEAFDTAGVGEITLKDILQDEEIPKVFFDVRNDSDALFSHFGIAL
ncbi:unnamed protein product [Alternaria alternata]